MREWGWAIIAEKTDEVLIWNCNNLDDQGKTAWYQHKIPYHRAYMRACHQEAHRRGLKVPEFNPYAS